MENERTPKILMVEDEEDVLKINARIMKRHGYDVLTAGTCNEAYNILKTLTPDLLILDVMLPDGSGGDICEYFRVNSQSPVIFLTGKTEIADKIDGLKKGGDYYITKPYDTDELLAVVERLCQRQNEIIKTQKQLTQLKKGSLELDIVKSKVTVNGKDALLTAKEFSLLLMLVQNEDKEVSCRDLFEKIWCVPWSDDIRTVRTHIKNLRKKLCAENAEDFDIVSSYGKGYTFTLK